MFAATGVTRAATQRTAIDKSAAVLVMLHLPYGFGVTDTLREDKTTATRTSTAYANPIAYEMGTRAAEGRREARRPSHAPPRP